MSNPSIAVVIPNWNGHKQLRECLAGLKTQTTDHDVVVVDNGSTDESRGFLATQPVATLELDKNYGFSGGVNHGISYALEQNYEYIALLNNDAKPEPEWLGSLVACLRDNPEAGIATSHLVDSRRAVDSTGDFYTSWGFAYPRDRGRPDSEVQRSRFDQVPSASGGASLYRAQVFRDVGLFDNNFFAYYEDVDLALRAQRKGYQVLYCKDATAIHDWGSTSSKIAGFTSYHTLKNHQLLFIKAMPLRLYVPGVFKFYGFSLPSLLVSHAIKGNLAPALRGLIVGLVLTPLYLIKRIKIELTMRVSGSYYAQLIVRGLPPQQKHKINKLLQRIGLK